MSFLEYLTRIQSHFHAQIELEYSLLEDSLGCASAYLATGDYLRILDADMTDLDQQVLGASTDVRSQVHDKNNKSC